MLADNLEFIKMDRKIDSIKDNTVELKTNTLFTLVLTLINTILIITLIGSVIF